MVIRGITSIILLPFLLLVLVGACWKLSAAGYGEWVMAEPSQEVQNFMRDVMDGDDGAARTYLGPKVAHTDLPALRWWILGHYGFPVTTTVEVRRESQDRAVLWTYSDTDSGHRYLIRWVVNFEHGRWVIDDLQGVHDIAPDL